MNNIGIMLFFWMFPNWSGRNITKFLLFSAQISGRGRSGLVVSCTVEVPGSNPNVRSLNLSHPMARYLTSPLLLNDMHLNSLSNPYMILNDLSLYPPSSP